MSKIRFRLGGYALALAISALTVGFLAVGPASASTRNYTPLKNATAHRLCLDVRSEDGLQNNGARLQLYHCTGVSEQKFFLVRVDVGGRPIPGGGYEIRPFSPFDQKCLIPNINYSAFTGQPVPNGRGAQVVQHSCYDRTQPQNWLAQNWYLKNTNEIVNQYWQTCLDTTGSGTNDHENVMIWPCNGNLTQRWIW